VKKKIKFTPKIFQIPLGWLHNFLLC
jgi:hypothetical protein